MSSDVLEIALPPFVTREEASLMMAVKLFETERLSLGQAAKLCSHSRRSFIEELVRLKVPVLNSSAGDLEGELAW